MQRACHPGRHCWHYYPGTLYSNQVTATHFKIAVPAMASGWHGPFNTLRLRQDGCHFPDDIFKRIFLNENAWILFTISLNFVPKGPINNIPSSVQIMAWRRSGDKPFSGPMMALFTDAYMRHSASMSLSHTVHHWYSSDVQTITFKYQTSFLLHLPYINQCFAYHFHCIIRKIHEIFQQSKLIYSICVRMNHLITYKNSFTSGQTYW